ncbi:MAG: EAL domain-containing protein [Rhodocyclaceae bacterium]|nr:EAL domain-containing protein [Rhodocyclaceae bacterium]
MADLPAKDRRPARPARGLGAALIVLWLATIASPGLAQTSALQDGKRVLLLYSYDPSFPTSAKILSGVRAILNAPGLLLDQEYLDARHLVGESGRQRYRDWLAFKLSTRRPYDAVIVSDDAAFELATRERDMFGNAPTVFIGVNNVRAAQRQSGRPGITGVVEHVSITETVRMARRLQPALKRLWVVSDATPGGRGDLATLRTEQGAFGGIAVEHLLLTELSWKELASRLRSLDAGDAVLLLAAYLDRDGAPKRFEESLALLRENTAVPIYHLWEHGIGEGLLGGYVMSHRVHAIEAARRVLDIWRGIPAEHMPVLEASPNLPIAHLPTLQGFRLDPADLPDDTELLGREPGLIERYPLQVATAIVALSLMGLLLILLVRKGRESRRLLAKSTRGEAMLRTLLDATADSIFFKAEDGRILACNSACAAALGRAADDIVGRRATELLPRELSESIERHDRRVMEQGESVRYRQALPLPDGTEMLYDTLKSPVRNGNGQCLGLVGVARDITADQRSMRRLQLAEEVFMNTSEGIMITDPDGVIERINPAFTTITGYSPEDVVGQRPNRLASGRQDRAFYRKLWRLLLDCGQWQGEIWNRRKSGELFPEWLNISAVRDTAGKPIHYVGIFSDISLIKSHEAKLQHMAHHDALTDLPNRVLLEDRIELALRRARRDHHMVGLVFIDLDNFKDINDSHGHLVGDQVLKSAATRIGTALRDGDTVARLGGDEFIVLIERLDSPADAHLLTDRIFAALAEPLLAGGSEFYIGASIGISIFPGDGDDSCELIRNADTAMYEAKKTGRYTVKAYSADQTDQVRQRAKMENALRRALSHGAIDVAYQPQFRHGGRSLVGIEALARWHDPQLGEVPPSQFIPLAESIGLIVPLGEFILRRVCTQMVAWRQQGVEPPRVAVNVSGHQLRRANFVSMLREILAETGCRAEQLEIEVTESDMLDRAQDSIATLAEIRALGVAVSMDDFGTGYSSLSYLKKLPIQTIKIDRSFIDGLPGDDNDRAIVDAIVALGRSLSLRVLAEGVETEAQAGFLGAHGCIEMQGYLYGRPTTPDAIARLLATAVG